MSCSSEPRGPVALMGGSSMAPSSHGACDAIPGQLSGVRTLLLDSRLLLLGAGTDMVRCAIR